VTPSPQRWKHPLYRPRWLNRLLSATLLTLACAREDGVPLPAPPSGFPFAYSAPSCAPWDGAATAVYLLPGVPDTSGAVDPQPVITVSVWRPVDSVPGATVNLTASGNMGAATSCSKPADCERATAATIRFRRLRPGGALEGSLDLTFPTRGHLTGGFHAPWRAIRVFCG
jgi:hypothetical protein